jgi:SAM-dependent methyltransferase
MPDLNTSLHTDMLKKHTEMLKKQSLARRLYRAIRRELTTNTMYGLEWGDPDTFTPLQFIKERWVIPYVRGDQTGLEIGPGGGRWTRYLLGFRSLYVVDYYSELLAELRKKLNKPNMIFVKNNGTDFQSVPDSAVDFIFSFGTFVHLDPPLIEAYLANMARILKSDGNAVVQYSDKTKVIAQRNPTFSQNNPEAMREMVTKAGFRILEEDLTTLWHSSLIRFTQ